MKPEAPVSSVIIENFRRLSVCDRRYTTNSCWRAGATLLAKHIAIARLLGLEYWCDSSDPQGLVSHHVRYGGERHYLPFGCDALGEILADVMAYHQMDFSLKESRINNDGLFRDPRVEFYLEIRPSGLLNSGVGQIFAPRVEMYTPEGTAKEKREQRVRAMTHIVIDACAELERMNFTMNNDYCGKEAA